MKSLHSFFIGSLAAVVASLTVAWHVQASGPLRYGSICTEEHAYDPNGKDANGNPAPGPWLITITGAKQGCTNFQNNLSSIGSSVFNWYTYYGEVQAMETQWVGWESTVESADILFMVGHGNSGNPWHDISGYNINDRVTSIAMRLGDTGTGLSFFSLWSCDGLTPYPILNNPNNTAVEGNGFPPYTFEGTIPVDVWTRWSKAMSGGLRMVAAAWGNSYISRMDAWGANYATYLKNGNAVSEAWRHASMDGANNNTPMVLATGPDYNTCQSRINNMTITNFNNGSYPRLVDANVGAYCWHAWW